MSIIIKIIGDNDGSDEYLAAEKLKKIIQSTAPSSAFGEVVLYPNATLFGMDVKDVDIMMIGHLQRATVKVNYYEKDTFEEGMISIESFCTTIEVKSHPVRSIKREGTSFLVKYREGWHNVTVQSNKQKYSAKGFFDKYLGGSPFITNIIWFTEVFPEELGQLLSFDKKEVASNVLPSNFDFKSLAQLLVFQNKPYNKRLSCNLNRNTDDYVKPLLFFSKAKEGMGVLTRKRIEQITQKELSEHQIDIGERFTILRGKAGTGKTIDIIRTAINLVNEKDARVQILTYNRALVSDIRRLFALADLPDMFDEKCVSINTMQSYFFGLTPLTLVKHEGSKSFVLKNEFENKGILLWDGTNDDRRLEYPVDSDESRILQYESCRGLEGWCVCCLDFDDYLRKKEEQYVPISNGNTLFLESAEDQKKRYLLNWALMPMTRAIDTLILVLADADSNYSKILLDEARQFPDYVEII